MRRSVHKVQKLSRIKGNGDGDRLCLAHGSLPANVIKEQGPIGSKGGPAPTKPP